MPCSKAFFISWLIKSGDSFKSRINFSELMPSGSDSLTFDIIWSAKAINPLESTSLGWNLSNSSFLTSKYLGSCFLMISGVM